MIMGIVRRRRIMVVAGAGAVAGGAALLWHERSKLAPYPRGSPLVVELDALPRGTLQTVEWRGLPVWLLRRSAAQIAALAEHETALADPESRQSLQPASCHNRQRSLRPDLFVAVGLCTHQGCTPALAGDDGFLCPCHASRYDLAGRVFKVGPATTNLVIPAYRFEADNRLLLGIDA